MKKILSRRPFLKRFLLSYLAILSIPFTLNIITFRSSSSVVRSYADKSNKALISQIRYSLDQRIEALENMVYQISLNKRMDSLSKQTQPLSPDFHIELVKSMNEINSYMMLENNIATDFFIVFLNSRYVMNGSTIIPFDIFFDYTYKYGDWDQNDWVDYLSGSYHDASFLKSEEILSGTEVYRGIPFVKTIPFYFNSTNSTFIIYNIRESDFFSYFYPEGRDWNSVPILYDSKTFEILADKPPDSKEKYIWMNEESQKYDLTYELNVPYRKVFQKLLLIRTIMIIINILFVVIGCAAAILLARSNAKPIYSIYNMVRSNLPETESTDSSYEYLNSSISQLISNNRSLETILHDHKEIISAEFYYRLVKYGFDTPAEMETIRTYVDRPMPVGISGVIIYNIPSDQFLETENSYVEIMEIKIKLINLMKEKSAFPGRWLDLDTLSIGYVFSTKETDRDQWYGAAEREIGILQRQLNSNMDLPCYWTLGNPVVDPFNLSTSYQQARLISDERRDYVNREIYEYRNFSPANREFILPMDIVQKIINLGKSGDSKLAVELFKENWEENIIEKSLSIRSRQIYFLELSTLLLRITPSIAEAPDFFEFHTKSEESIHNLVIEKINEMGDSIRQVSENSHEEMKNKLLIHVKDNFHDNNLCLCSIAEVFGKSESYISHFFKKFCSDNFYHYLEKLRMEEAKALLIQTDLPIKEITDKTGYSSMHSFRRAFKKIYGVSPSSFREI